MIIDPKWTRKAEKKYDEGKREQRERNELRLSDIHITK